MSQKGKPPRLQIPVPDETRLLLQAYADATGASLPKVCSDILVETGPVMAELAKSILLAKEAPAKAMRDVTGMLDTKISELDQMQMDLNPKPEKKRKRK